MLLYQSIYKNFTEVYLYLKRQFYSFLVNKNETKNLDTFHNQSEVYRDFF